MKTEYDAKIDDGAAALAGALRGKPEGSRVSVWSVASVHATREVGYIFAGVEPPPGVCIGRLCIVPAPAGYGPGGWGAVPYSSQHQCLWHACRREPILNSWEA